MSHQASPRSRRDGRRGPTHHRRRNRRRRRRASRHRAGGEPGQATVELALLLPVVAVIALFVVQLALVVRAQILTVQVAREAARAAAVDPRPDAARRAAGAPGLDPSALRVEVQRQAGKRLVHVVITYRARTDVSLVGAALPDITVRAEATMRTEDASAQPS